MQEATELIAQGKTGEEFDWIDGFDWGNRAQQQKPDKKRQKLIERSRKNRELLGDMATNLMLYSATQERQYLSNFEQQIWDALELRLEANMQDQNNPYGVPIGLGNWAGVNMVLNYGITVNYAHIYYPDIVKKDEIYRVANWLFGCHPYHNYSFVAAVGAARPKQVFYGNNRADFSFIPGNVAPGLLFRKPDHFENFDDWPFLWGQNEGTIAGNTQYIIFGSSFKNIVNKEK